MQKANNKFIDIALLALASLILMAYGWYLGQLHQSGYDVAGILLFITGVAGFLLEIIIRYFTRKFNWYNTWLANILTGVTSCGIIFVVILVVARLHG